MLHLRTFGGLSVEGTDAVLTGAARQRKTLALLALLAASGQRGMSRDKIVALLWPESDAEHARSLLKQACYALRRDLHAPDLFLGAPELRLNGAVMGSDVGRFADALERDDLAAAVGEYAGPFLDGFYLAAGGEFDRWVEDTRAQLMKRAAEALERLATRASAAGDMRSSVRWWRRLTELDRLSSHAAGRLIEALVAAGDRAAALEFGQAHERIIRELLGTTPDVAVTDLLQRLRRAGEAPRSASRVLVATAPRPALFPSRVLGKIRVSKRVVIGAAVVVVAGGAVVAGTRRPVPLDAALMVVAPFEALDSTLQGLQEPLLNALSRSLDGFGPIRTVPPSEVVGRWERRYDRASATALGRRTGAGIVLFGQLSSVRPDSVRLRLAILDVLANGVVAEVDRTAPADARDRLIDSLSVDVIRAMAPAAGIPQRALSLGTRSLPAIKAFIQGERYFRRFALDSAVASYDRAILLDSTFAVALHAAARARAWNFQPAEPFVWRAVRFNRGLSALDSLLIARNAPDNGGAPLSLRAGVARSLGILFEASQRYPEEPEVWFELGDLQFHNGFAVWWNTWNDARASFDRAIALDSSHAVAYIHPVEIALNDNDLEAARRYVRGYLAIPGVNPEGGAMRLLGLLLQGTPQDRREFDRALETAGFYTLRRLMFAIQRWPDSAETQLTVARRLLARAEATISGGSPGGDYNLRVYRSLLAHALVFRGHLREARAVVGGRFVMPAFMELAELGAIPPDTIDAAVARWLQFPDHPDYGGDHVLYPWLKEAACYRKVDVAWWWVARRDTAQLQRLVRQEDSTARLVHPATASPYARPVPAFAHLALSLARGDSATALRQLWIFPDSLCPDSRHPPEALFHILDAAGRRREAETVFDWRHDRWVPWVLARARLAERRGDRATAVKYYQFVVQAWLGADPELQPVVAEARAGIVRLGERAPQ